MSSDHKDDRELVDEFKNGNTAVFDELVRRYAVKLYQTAYGLLSNHHDAEEVAQDAFVRAYRSLNKFRGDSNLSTWLHRIVTNLARNKYHWNRRRGSGHNLSIYQYGSDLGNEQQEEEMPLPDSSLKPDLMMEHVELEKTLADGLNSLPESLRETMVLRHVHNMPYDKIAETLKCRIGTIKSRIARGREMLRQHLAAKDLKI